MDESQIVYEQPLNELIRVSLRFEYLFQQIDNCFNVVEASKHTHTVVRLIIDLINLSDRPDLKTKLNQEFNRYAATLSRLNHSPEINQEKLANTLNQLKELTNHFLNSQGKIAQTLRNNEFIATLRQNIITPGGGNGVDTPQYFHWLNQPATVRETTIKSWITPFKEIRTAIELLLNIVRNSSSPQEKIAEQGFYHETLDPQAPCQLIRASLPKTSPVSPEISVGRHRLSIRFIIPNTTARSSQTPNNVHFTLTKCII